jgi:hypothetical protein
MPRQAVVEAFVETVTSGDYVGAIERFYAAGASMQENQAPPRVGRDGLARHEQGVMNAFESIACEIVGPPVIHGNVVAIQWRFAFRAADGRIRTLREVAWQRWEDDKIAEETFFYDPGQMAV